MNRRAFMGAVLGAAALAAVPARGQSAPTRIVIQVSDEDPRTWNQALNVVRNLQQAYGKDKVDIEVVVFGNGIGLLRDDSPLGNRVEETLAGGAQVLMCENTMRARKVTKNDMLPKIGYVPAGIVEIVEKQKAGWVVVRP